VSPPLDLTVNGQRRSVPPGTTIAGLLAELGAGPRGVAVARNESVVPRSAWDDTAVVADDRIEILDAAQGG
jgi:sulfur carrier protein